VGGVSERAGAEAGGIPFAIRRRPWRWKASRSSGRRRSSRGAVGTRT